MAASGGRTPVGAETGLDPSRPPRCWRADLDARYPGLRFRVVDETGCLRPNMRIFVNGLTVRDLAQALRPDDEIAIVLALSGG